MRKAGGESIRSREVECGSKKSSILELELEVPFTLLSVRALI